MAVEKMVSYAEFQSNPELKAQFGDYSKYLDSFAAKLSGMGLFNFAQQNSGAAIPGLNKTSIFFSAPQTITSRYQAQVQEKEDKKQANIQEKLDKITDPKLRAKIEAELGSKDLSEALFELMMDRYERKPAEFEEIWAKYQAAKGEAADMKKACERILREYQQNQNSSLRGRYLAQEHKYNEADMWADIYLSEAMEVSHRVT